MNYYIVATIITGAVTIIAVVLSGLLQNSKTKWRIEQLEAKQDKHNKLVERMVAVEHRAKSNTHRLDRMEGSGE